MRRQLRLQQAALRRGRALAWHRYYYARYHAGMWTAQHGAVAVGILLLVFVAVSTFWIPALQGCLEPLFASEERLQGLRSLFQTLGGALLGATAIVSSLVLFSVQVNVERMPHGLFRRLSADRRLLSAFAAAFLLAVLVAAFSLIFDRRLIGASTLGATWAIVVILILFFYSYRRALGLINPLQQLRLVVITTRREFRAWLRRAKRAAPLFASSKPPPGLTITPLSQSST
jgi:hypothetical protein